MEGTIRTAAQEHFYLETHSCIAIPSGETKEMELRVCSQEINMVQVCLFVRFFFFFFRVLIKLGPSIRIPTTSIEGAYIINRIAYRPIDFEKDLSHFQWKSAHAPKKELPQDFL